MKERIVSLTTNCKTGVGRMEIVIPGNWKSIGEDALSALVLPTLSTLLVLAENEEIDE